MVLGSSALSLAQSNVQGAVELSNGTKVPQNPSLPKLNLTNIQREVARLATWTSSATRIRLGNLPDQADIAPVSRTRTANLRS